MCQTFYTTIRVVPWSTVRIFTMFNHKLYATFHSLKCHNASYAFLGYLLIVIVNIILKCTDMVPENLKKQEDLESLLTNKVLFYGSTFASRSFFP